MSNGARRGLVFGNSYEIFPVGCVMIHRSAAPPRSDSAALRNFDAPSSTSSRRRGMRSLTRSRDRLFCCLPPLLVIPSRNPRFLSQVAVVNYTSRTMSENDVSGQGAREGMLDMLLVYVMEHNQITSLFSTVAASGFPTKSQVPH